MPWQAERPLGQRCLSGFVLGAGLDVHLKSQQPALAALRACDLLLLRCAHAAALCVCCCMELLVKRACVRQSFL